MKDENKTPAQLITELTALRQRVRQFEAATETNQRTQDELHFQKTLLECQSEAALEGILVVSSARKWLTFNQRFIQMWGLSELVVETRSSALALQTVLAKLVNPELFMAQVTYLYHHPDEQSQDEVRLTDGRIFHRYSAPVKRTDGFYYGRVWYYRDISARKQAEQEREQLVATLQKKLAEIRMLSGMLPICAWCKRIEDDEGDWKQLEVYVAERSEADFTHGICPECYQTVYSAEVGDPSSN